MSEAVLRRHTLVVSDLHLSDAETPDPKKPLWKRFKRRRHFVDDSFQRFLSFMEDQIQGPPGSIELVLNGDIFDFDSVIKVPDFFGSDVSWLEKRRGLSAEEQKSRFKLKIILEDHSVWLKALRDFLLRGHFLVWVIGNHDIECHWESVQQDIWEALKLPQERRTQVRFCEWFYVSEQDTLIEHGNQYDAYCLCSNPINPLVQGRKRPRVRLPFGNVAGKWMVNGIGLMNPHATTSFIKSSFLEYIVFYYRYVLFTQPLLVWTWLWSSFLTLYFSLLDGFLPPLRNPLGLAKRLESIARKSQVPLSTVLALRELHVHPAIFNPFKILRELWLDRALLLLLMFFLSFQIFSFVNVFYPVSFWWFLIPNLFFFPIFIFYARSVESEVEVLQNLAFDREPLAARIAGVKRVIFGHTHLEVHTQVEEVEIFNTGTWSPAFHDVECLQPYGRKCFAWLAPGAEDPFTREGRLYEWTGREAILIDKR